MHSGNEAIVVVVAETKRIVQSENVENAVRNCASLFHHSENVFFIYKSASANVSEKLLFYVQPNLIVEIVES